MAHVRITCLFLISFLSLSHGQVELDFSQSRGFYESAFDLEITATSPNAIIRYTLNGDEPSPIAGTIYDAAIPITTTAVIRAIAYEVDVDTSAMYTHSYLFLNDVIRQPAMIDGWPNNSYNLGGSGQAIHDYEMDSAIVDSPLYSEDILQGLKDIPSLSIVMPRGEFWEMYDGEVEKKTSIELLYADDESKNEQEDCGIEPHSHLRLKRSMRLSFKKIYGEANWDSAIFRNAAVGAESAVDKFDRIVLRGGNNRAWSRNWNEDRTAFTRDEWMRQSQIAASGLGSHGTFVHLYVNGLYWGLYNPVERLDEGFTSSYLGGEKEDWFAVSHGGNQGGDATRYNYMTNELINKDLSDSLNYIELNQYLDIDHFADYLIVSWMTGVQDWPRNNWWGGNRNNPVGTFKYFGWDNEWSWDETRNANNGAWVHPEFRRANTEGRNSALVFNKAKVNEDFMTAFSDRVYKLCFNQGPLTDDNSRLRWAALNDNIRHAVVAESARWGDALDDGVTRTRDEHWQDEVDRLDGLMDGNVERLITALRVEQYYPTIDPPLFNNNNLTIEVQEIAVPNNYTIDLTNPNPNGDIYYTIDGTDPRMAGGGISSNAFLYVDQELIINSAITLQARIKNGDEWSALHCLQIFLQQDLSPIKLTEIMYNPSEFDTIAGTELEFLEIKNTSMNDAIDISGLTIVDGVDFTFPTATIMEPQSFIVLASNRHALALKCPGIEIFGEFDGQLSNGGEKIEFVNFDQETIIFVEYDDKDPWREEADGDGYSLVSSLTNPIGDQDDAMLWTISENNTCGSPGADEIDPSSTSTLDQDVTKALIYPNPASVNDQVIIQSANRIRSVQLFSNHGKRMRTAILSKLSHEFIIQNPSQAGTFILEIEYENGALESRVLVID